MTRTLMEQEPAEFAIWVGVLIDILQSGNVGRIILNASLLQFMNNRVLQVSDEESVGQNPEANEVVAFWHLVRGAVNLSEVYLLSVKPMYQKMDCTLGGIIYNAVGLGLALPELAIKRGFEHRRIVASKLLVDNECFQGWCKLARGNVDGDKFIELSVTS
jgi:hypothetical protein